MEFMNEHFIPKKQVGKEIKREGDKNREEKRQRERKSMQ